MECANVDLKADIERWHINKREDLRELFTDYADRHVTYHDEVCFNVITFLYDDKVNR